MKKLSLIASLLVALVALMLWMPRAHAVPTYYTSQSCSACHGATATCNGCHQHGTHSSLGGAINVTGTTNKTTYAPGETVTVTITGGWQSGWIRTILYDQNMTELARSTGTVAAGAIAPSGGPGYPVTLTAPAPMTPGTYTWNVSWYGNQYDTIGPYQPTCSSTLTTNCWKPSSNANHGEEIRSTNSFSVVGAAPAPKINLNPASLNFGTVTVGSSVTLNTLVQNTGNANLVVSSVARCSGTSTEFTWSPTATPITIPAGGSATLSVIYSPTVVGADAGCLDISSNDPATPTAVLNVTGSGAPVLQPKISLNPSSLNFGTVTVGGSGTLTTQIQNLGNADLVVSGVARCSGTSAEFSSPTAVPVTIPAGGNATLTVIYSPVDTTTDTGCMNVTSNDPATPVAALNVSGTGSPVLQPKIGLNPSSLNFGTVTIGNSATLTTLVQNTGNANLVVSSIGLCTGTSTEFTWSPTAAPITIPAGGSAALSVTYNPVNTGSTTGCLNLSSNDPATPVAVLSMSGTGSPMPQPKINLNPSSLNFGTVMVGGSGTLTTQIQNLGNADLVVSSIGLCAGTSAEFSSPTPTPITIPAGSNVTVTVIYSPSDAGPDAGCLNLSSNDPAAPVAALNVTGTGSSPVQQPQINLNPTGLDFGTVTVGGSATKTAQIQNTGSADLVVSSIDLCPGTSAEFSSSTAVPLTIPAGGSTTLSVMYSPADAGVDTGCLNLSSNDPVTPTTALTLAGTGSSPTGGAADFDIVSFSATHEIELSGYYSDSAVRFALGVVNKGPVDGTASARLVGVLSGERIYDQTITVSAPAGGSAAFAFPRYRPSAAGIIRWTVTINDPTPDTATATTTVEREGYSSGTYTREGDD